MPTTPWARPAPTSGRPSSATARATSWASSSNGPAPADRPWRLTRPNSTDGSTLPPGLTRRYRAGGSAAEGTGGLGGPVGKHDVGAGAPDRGERLEDRPLAVDPAPRGGRLDHGVLARDVVRRHAHVHGVADPTDHVEVAEGRLHHDDVGPLLDVEQRFADSLDGVGSVLLVGTPVALQRGRHRLPERAEEGRGVLGRVGEDRDVRVPV